MPSKVFGKVTKHIEDGDWHKFTINKLELKSKFLEAYEGLEQGMTVEAEYTEQKSGNYTNRFLGKWKELEDTGDGPPINDVAERSQPAQVDPAVWENKDRRIAMESSYSSAARFYQNHPDVTPKELAALARAIFRDVINAPSRKVEADGSEG